MPSNRFELPSATITFGAGDSEFEADPFELWDGMLQLHDEISKQETKERFAYQRAVAQWIEDNFAVRLTIRQVNGLLQAIPGICTEKKSESSPTTEPTAEPAGSTASLSSGSQNEEY